MLQKIELLKIYVCMYVCTAVEEHYYLLRTSCLRLDLNIFLINYEDAHEIEDMDDWSPAWWDKVINYSL